MITPDLRAAVARGICSANRFDQNCMAPDCRCGPLVRDLAGRQADAAIRIVLRAVAEATRERASDYSNSNADEQFGARVALRVWAQDIDALLAAASAGGEGAE